MAQSFEKNVFNLITGEEDARVCKDIPDSACRHEPRNGLAYMLANLLNKIADELTSARLILPWLLTAIGAPAVFSSFVVPIRESGVLLPQLMVAAVIRRMPVRKSVWLWGAGLSAASLMLMALVVKVSSGVAAGWGIIGGLIIFSLARGLCSVSAKDVLGKTVSKGRRGAIMGYSAGISGIVTLAFGFYVERFTGTTPTTHLMIILLLVSAAFWVLALFSFAAIREQPGATEGGGNAMTVALRSLGLLKTDQALRRFVLTRILLLGTALAPPFYVILAQTHTDGGLSGLGILIIASGIASSLSSPIWGRLGDYSSRLVMMLAAGIAAILGISVFFLAMFQSGLLANPWFHGFLYLVLIIVHSGVRLGRKVYLVDLATADTRASYVAVSNTVIGIAMLFGGAIGLLADYLSVQYVILILGMSGAAAALSVWWLPAIKQ